MTHPFLPDRPVDENRSAHDLAQGGIPLRAQRRIHELNASGRAGCQMFTSTLTPSETVVARATGLSPVSQVMGSSVFHVGFRGYTSWGGGELTTLTAAYDRARSLALSRMQQEAAMLGTHMVIDVRFMGRGYEWAEDLLEVTAVGTAVRIDGQAATVPQPVLTLLTADELYKLHRAGYWPVGIAIGNCFYYVRHADCFSEGNWYSSELTAHTQASQVARDLAVARFRAFAAHFQAHGVLGVKVHRNAKDREYESNDRSHTAFSLDLMITGTAVVRRGNPEPPPRPPIVVDLRDLKSRYGNHG